MTHETSYRQILRSSSIIGGAALIDIAIGVLRTKAVAVLLGPAGIGLMGLLQSLVSVMSSVAALGFANVGTRQVAAAAASGDLAALNLTRHALVWGTAILGIAGTVCFWLLRRLFATQVLDDAGFESGLSWLSIAVGLTVVAGSQTALLNGLRRVGDLARLTIGAALLSTIVGIAAIAAWRADGLVLFVLAGPACSFALGYWFVSRLKAPSIPLPNWRELAAEWKGMARLGTALMLSGLVGTGVQLAVRTMVQRELGADALGLFHAAWSISMTYVGFVLSAMAADYYPRLAGVIHQRAEANRTVNEQAEVALLLAAPVFLMVLGFAPAILRLLYADSFLAASSVLRWQILGDVLKIMSWPLGFIFLAAGNGRTFLATEILGMTVFALVTWFALPVAGVQATGIAFLAMYAVYLPVTHRLACRIHGFRWQASNVVLLAAVFAAACAIAATAHFSPEYAAWAGALGSIAAGAYSLNRLGILTKARN